MSKITRKLAKRTCKTCRKKFLLTKYIATEYAEFKQKVVHLVNFNYQPLLFFWSQSRSYSLGEKMMCWRREVIRCKFGKRELLGENCLGYVDCLLVEPGSLRRLLIFYSPHCTVQEMVTKKHQTEVTSVLSCLQNLPAHRSMFS